MLDAKLHQRMIARAGQSRDQKLQHVSIATATAQQDIAVFGFTPGVKINLVNSVAKSVVCLKQCISSDQNIAYSEIEVLTLKRVPSRQKGVPTGCKTKSGCKKRP
jgi:hypothetical protein